MPKTVFIGDQSFDFPDDATDEQIIAALSAMVSPPKTPTPRLARSPLPPVEFEPAVAVGAAAEEQVKEAAEEELAARGPLIADADLGRERKGALARARDEMGASRGRAIQAGAIDEPVRQGDAWVFPTFRATRARDQPIFREVDIPAGTTGVIDPQLVAAEERRFPTPLVDPEPLEIRKVIKNKDGSRPAAAWEEIVESLAQQTVLTEEEARRRQGEIVAQMKDLEKRVNAGEDVPFYETAGPVLSGILSAPSETGAGIQETSLGAALRGGLGVISALAAEGYFRGLGYEVDENGVPKDPDDLGLAIGKVREAAGIPAFVSLRTASPIGELERLVNLSGLDKEGDFSRLLDAYPQMVFPLPGSPSLGTTKRVTNVDPNGNRRVSEIEVPSPIEDWSGFVDAESRRIARNIASGRTMGDEFVDHPDIQRFYAHTWGDPDAAFYAGSALEVLVPATPIGPAKAVGFAGNVVADLVFPAAKAAVVRAAKRAQATAAATAIRAAEAAKARKIAGASTESPILRGPADSLGFAHVAAEAAAKAASKAAQAAALAVAGPVADVAAAIIPGRASDVRVVQRVAEQVLDASDLDPDTIAAAKKLLRPADQYQKTGSTLETVDEVMNDMAPALMDMERPDEVFLRLHRLIARNVPDDLVMVTENVAVPRSSAPQIKRVIDAKVKDAFVVSPAEQANRLSRMADEQDALGNAALAEQMRVLSTRIITGRASKKVVDKVVARHRQITGKGATTLGELSQRAPAEALARMGVPLPQGKVGDVIKNAKSWADVPVEDRQLFVELIRQRAAIDAAPQVARYARDLTAAQVHIRAHKPWDRLINPKGLDSPVTRRLRAMMRGGAPRETVAVSRAREAIRGSARASLDEVSKSLNALAKKHGSVDAAIEELARIELNDLPAENVWQKLFATMYGEDKAETVALQAQARGLIPDQNEFPSIKTLMAIDRTLTIDNVLDGIRGQDPAHPIRTWLLTMFAPDFHKVYLKVIMEEGVKKAIAKKGRRFEQALNAVNKYADEDMQLYRHERLATLPDQTVSVPIGMTWRGRAIPSVPTRVYDVTQSHAERVLAENGEEFVELLESINPRLRGSVQSMAIDALDFVLVGLGRNIPHMAKYGYVLPNLPYLSGRLMAMPIIALSTSGAARTLKASARAVKQLLARKTGAGIQARDGLYYSPRMLDDLANQFGIGYSAVKAERVGSLADDLLRDARKAASPHPKLAAVLDEAHPLSKSIYMRFAEAIEMSFRRAVFETGIADGMTPSDAAKLARDSLFDYDDVPDLVRNMASKFVATAAGSWSIHGEFVRQLMANPDLARKAAKGMMAKQRAQDPFNVHGDKALKSLGIVTVDGTQFYGPEVPIFAPVETTLGILRNANLFLTDLGHALSADGEIGDVGEVVLDGGVAVTRALFDEVLPSVLDAYERFGESATEEAQSIGQATPVSDEKMFWAALIYANRIDPDRSSGTWALVVRTLRPEVVPPPDALASKKPGQEAFWTAQPPEGIPHVFWGRDEDGAPLFLALKPSKQGLRNLTVARALTTESMENALGFGASLVDAPAIQAEGVIPKTAAGAAAALTLAPAGTSDENVRAAQQAEAIRTVREDF